MGTGEETTGMEPVESNLADYKTSSAHVEEIAIARLTDEAIFELSAESLNLRSKTGLRIFGVMFVQGCIMAGYGIDWCVIGGINNFDVRPHRCPSFMTGIQHMSHFVYSVYSNVYLELACSLQIR